MIGGDFNCYDNPLDKFGGNVSVGTECKALKSDFVLVVAQITSSRARIYLV